MNYRLFVHVTSGLGAKDASASTRISAVPRFWLKKLSDTHTQWPMTMPKMQKWTKNYFGTFIEQHFSFGESNVKSDIASFCLVFGAFLQLDSFAGLLAHCMLGWALQHQVSLVPLVFMLPLVYYLRKHLSLSISDWFWGVCNFFWLTM